MLTKLGSTCPVEPTAEKVQKSFFSKVFLQRSKKSRTFAWIFSQGRQNVLLNVHKNNWRKTSSQKFQMFQFLFGYWAKTFGRLLKLSRRVFERAFNMWKKICGTFFTLGSPTNINFFSLSASGFPSTVETYLAKFSKLPSTCPKEHMENIVFSKINIFFNICRWAINIRHFAKSLSTGLSKVDFTCPKETFEEKGISNEKKISVLFVHWAKKSGISGKTCSAIFSKLFSSCPNNFLEEKLWGEKRRWEVWRRDVGNHYYQRRCAAASFWCFCNFLDSKC